MLVLSMSSSLPSPHHEPRKLSLSQPSLQGDLPTDSDTHTRFSGAMLSVLPPARRQQQRPKLSLQTSLSPLFNSEVRCDPIIDTSPTARNTLTNTYDLPTQAPASAIQPIINRSPSLTVPAPSRSRSALNSPLLQDAPYLLPLRAHSILRNSPLPKRHLPATSTLRAHKRIFVPTKRVAFAEKPADIIPPADFENTDDNEMLYQQINDTERERRKVDVQAEDSHYGRTADREKDWISRPMPDEILALKEEDDNAASGIV